MEFELWSAFVGERGGSLALFASKKSELLVPFRMQRVKSYKSVWRSDSFHSIQLPSSRGSRIPTISFIKHLQCWHSGLPRGRYPILPSRESFGPRQRLLPTPDQPTPFGSTTYETYRIETYESQFHIRSNYSQKVFFASCNKTFYFCKRTYHISEMSKFFLWLCFSAAPYDPLPDVPLRNFVLPAQLRDSNIVSRECCLTLCKGFGVCLVTSTPHFRPIFEGLSSMWLNRGVLLYSASPGKSQKWSKPFGRVCDA